MERPERAAGPILCVVGARPNFIKIAPIMEALAAAVPALPARLVHTGQHYDVEMNQSFFEQLGIPAPDLNLEVGSGSHAQQTAEIMRRFEPVVRDCRPAAVLVVGDVNSTIACALVAVKLGVPVVHVEAGLRSYDRGMPEEINRVLTDQIAALLFTTERAAADNLAREGIAAERVHFVGNIMIDTLMKQLPRTEPPRRILAARGAAGAAAAGDYALLTLHRPSNVDAPAVLCRLLQCMRGIGERLPVIFPVHPRTRRMIDDGGLAAIIDGRAVVALPPLGYLEMLGLMAKARLVLTDSGGIQEETTALGVPCVTLRDNTERPITVSHGTNTLAGSDPARIAAVVDEVLNGGGKRGRVPELWDGRAAPRIQQVLSDWLSR